MKNWRIQLKVGWRNELERKLTDYTVGKVIEARTQSDMSQRQLAHLLGRSNAYISQIESGRIDLGVVDLIGIAWLLDKPIKYFLPVYEKPEGDLLDAQEHELLEQFRNIRSKKTRDLGIKLVQQLTESDIQDSAKLRSKKPKKKSE